MLQPCKIHTGQMLWESMPEHHSEALHQTLGTGTTKHAFYELSDHIITQMRGCFLMNRKWIFVRWFSQVSEHLVLTCGLGEVAAFHNRDRVTRGQEIGKWEAEDLIVITLGYDVSTWTLLCSSNFCWVLRDEAVWVKRAEYDSLTRLLLFLPTQKRKSW